MSISLRFITTHSPVSWAIRAFCWSPYSHVDIALPEGLLGAQKDGVKIRPFNYCRPTRVCWGVVDCSDEVTDKVVKFAKAQIGKGYDYATLFGNLFHRDWDERNTWDCSYLVANAFAEAGDPLLDTPHPNRIKPSDLLLSTKIHILNTLPGEGKSWDK